MFWKRRLLLSLCRPLNTYVVFCRRLTHLTFLGDCFRSPERRVPSRRRMWPLTSLDPAKNMRSTTRIGNVLIIIPAAPLSFKYLVFQGTSRPHRTRRIAELCLVHFSSALSVLCKLKRASKCLVQRPTAILSLHARREYGARPAQSNRTLVVN